MSFLVSSCFLLHVLLQGFGQVHSRLVGDDRATPKARRPFLLPRLSFSPALNDWSPYFRAMTRASSPTSSVSTAILVSSLKYRTPYCFYPMVYRLLGFFCAFRQCRQQHQALPAYSLFFVSMQMVTGPSFSNSTFMSAPKSPVPIVFPMQYSIHCRTVRTAERKFPVWLPECKRGGCPSWSTPSA